MTLPGTDTEIRYAAGDTSATALVLHVEEAGDGLVAVLLDRTAAHPVDAGWPDQGPDRGALLAGGARLELRDCVVGATDGAVLHLGADVPVRKGAEGWAFVVAHLVEADAAAAAGLREGGEVEVEVDRPHRRALSLGHSACHLASLALNAELAGAWRKVGRRDAAGSPDFDGTAIERSTIEPHGSVDEYRVGKSVRKAGFDPAALDDLPSLTAAVQARLDAWTASSGTIRMELDGPGLADRRRWTAELPEGEVRIPCGGTHASALAELAGLRVVLAPRELEGAVGVTMTTCVPAA
ncbi:metal-dependent hydrolase [Homoserinibacter sp. YIM 151385]|uniref:metal-dependent hydrolase n=1 Tax=Homoserinibacter sp. YIM 151385 TaxID=2985506 RepID=UPI0022F1228C|nr:metal-dependent hydrolase [Homoserinibacter sp. YIM 151385]WBU37939.1 metal-dependent hydrolase [Homoserinibacter sp. YIM 151385]